jgi:ADP-ribose pyrophosphatase YjhB (NUDIX family)
MDEPIAHTKDGRPIYDNTATVCIGVVRFFGRGLLAIRRNTEPGKGKLALPGGFHMRGETWQEALVREVKEETGVVIQVDDVRQIGNTVTDKYGHNLIFGYASTGSVPDNAVTDGEAGEVLWISTVGDAEDWAFPLHYEQAYEVLDNTY